MKKLTTLSPVGVTGWMLRVWLTQCDQVPPETGAVIRLVVLFELSKRGRYQHG